ncbi:hypothetical protein MIND_00500000 [Mycena indigotica]|uniref:Uncharacterized protein n=1 Tax=Mycena indigotica TaxID=2126181 RepID=A0A8H6SXA8_9AGAR|nr:uncharacterized protein MIND_00500000 [Mycena indigotica]KAF7307069.1 hypothetical protein MIND_00500000 [Mycena indigotica]
MAANIQVMQDILLRTQGQFGTVGTATLIGRRPAHGPHLSEICVVKLDRDSELSVARGFELWICLVPANRIQKARRELWLVLHRAKQRGWTFVGSKSRRQFVDSRNPGGISGLQEHEFKQPPAVLGLSFVTKHHATVTRLVTQIAEDGTGGFRIGETG